VRGANTRSTVLDWLVGDAELAKVATDHLRLKIKTQCRTRMKVKHASSLTVSS